MHVDRREVRQEQESTLLRKSLANSYFAMLGNHYPRDTSYENLGVEKDRISAHDLTRHVSKQERET